MVPNTHHGLFPMHHLWVLTHITQKLQVVLRSSTNWMTALLSKMSTFWVGAECKIQLASYGSKSISQSLTDTPFVRTFMHNLKASGHMWTFCISNNFSTIKDIPCVVLSCMRNPTGEVRSQTCITVVLWCDIFMHTLQAYRLAEYAWKCSNYIQQQKSCSY